MSDWTTARDASRTHRLMGIQRKLCVPANYAEQATNYPPGAQLSESDLPGLACGDPARLANIVWEALSPSKKEPQDQDNQARPHRGKSHPFAIRKSYRPLVEGVHARNPPTLRVLRRHAPHSARPPDQ